MTVAEMRALLGLGPGVSDAAVADAYAAFLAGEPDEQSQPPISMVEARRQLKMEIDDDSRDDEIAGLIERAVGWVERETDCLMSARTITLPFDHFDALVVRKWPVQRGATAVVQYTDGVDTVSGPAVRLVGARRPHRVQLAAGAAWPDLPDGELVLVTLRAGYEPGEAVPADLRSAALLMLTAYDVDREGGDVFQKAETAARNLCFPFTSLV